MKGKVVVLKFCQIFACNTIHGLAYCCLTDGKLHLHGDYRTITYLGNVKESTCHNGRPIRTGLPNMLPRYVREVSC